MWGKEHAYFRRVAGIGLLLRFIMLAWGEYQDANLPQKYSDIDYTVFTDGAREVYNGGSPFDRATYRYTPLLAWLMIPNVAFFMPFGKILFAVVDVFCAYLIYAILCLRGVSGRDATIYSSVYTFNPIIMQIATRGSCDMIIVAMVLGVVLFMMQRRFWASTLLFGMAVHFRIYPVIHAVPLVLFLDRHAYPGGFIGEGVMSQLKNAWCTRGGWAFLQGGPPLDEAAQDSALATDPAVANGSTDTTAAYGARSRGSRRSRSSSRPASRRAGKQVVKGAGTGAREAGNEKLSGWWGGGSPFLLLTPHRIIFGLVSGGFFFLLIAALYQLYGYTFLYEAYLHHLTRADNRHNFSAYFYDLYLRYDMPSRTGKGLLAFLPQFGTLTWIGIRFYRDLPLCFLLQTLVFVAFNKVITAQYFMWWMALLPLVLPTTTLSIPRFAILTLLWLAGYATFLAWAYSVEITGVSTFREVWAGGLLFLVGNVAWIVSLVVSTREAPVFEGGKRVRVVPSSHQRGKGRWGWCNAQGYTPSVPRTSAE